MRFWTYMCGGGTETEDLEMSAASDTANSTSTDVSDADSGSEQIKSPEQITRRCTDAGGIWLWAGCLVLFTACLVLGATKEERHPFVRLTNKRGTQCGVYDQKGRDSWFLCTANKSDFAEAVPICVRNCGAGDGLASYCAHAVRAEDEDAVDNPSTMPTSTNFTYLARQAGPLCVPVNAPQAEAFRNQLVSRGLLPLDMFLTAQSSWPPLAFSAILSILVSHAWIRVLRDHARTLAWAGVYLLVLLPVICLAYQWLKYGNVAIFSVALSAIAVCCIVGWACQSQENLDRAAMCLHCACQCVTEMPILEFGPAAVLALQLASAIAIVWALAFMPTTLHVDLRTGHIGCQVYGSSTRNLADVSVAVIYVLFLCFVLNVMTAVWEMGIVFLTVCWYVSRRASTNGPTISKSLRVLCIMCRYHAGTIILAGILIGFARPFRFLLGTLTAVTRMRTNPVKEACTSCCSCFVSLYNLFLQPLSANAYVDVALRGSALLPATRKSQQVTSLDPITPNSLNGATFVFQVICLALTWWLGFVTTYVAVTMVPAYREPKSVSFVRYTEHWCIISGFVAAACAYPFVMVFDVASDTILHLTTLSDSTQDELRHSGAEAPMTIVDMLYSIVVSLGLGCGGERG